MTPGPSFVLNLLLAAGVAPASATSPAWAVAGVSLFACVGVSGYALWRIRTLRNSDRYFRELFANGVEGVYETGPDGWFRRANTALARMLGYDHPEQLLAAGTVENLHLYVSPTRRAEFFAALGSGNQVLNFESEIRRKDGTRAWVSENVHALRDAEGRVVRLQGFVSDITARKQAELALRASEARFRVLFEHSPIGIVQYDYRATVAWLDSLRSAGIVDLNSWFDAHPDELQTAMSCVAITGANEAALRLVGARTFVEAVANMPRIFTAEAYAARRSTFLALWDGTHHSAGDLSIHSLDGTVRRLHFAWWTPSIDGRPLFDQTQLAFLDLTAALAAEQALAAERERLSVTLRAMAEGVITTDTDGTVQFLNDAAAELTGWPIGLAERRPLEQVCPLVSDGIEPHLQIPATAALTQDRAIDLPPQTVLRQRNGNRKRVEGRCAPMHDLAGRAIGTVLVFRDVTERAQYEVELLRASKMESVGVLAGGIAHDFNNFLTVILGNVSLSLSDAQLPPHITQLLREAERGTLRARELTQQLLTFARGGEPVRAAVALPEIVREAAAFGLHGAAAKCEFDFAPDLQPADVDRGQIAQVVQNLVINAAHAMRGGGGVIHIRVRNERLLPRMAPVRPGDYVRLEVSDSGRGIAKEHLSRIFEPFFTTKEYGNGLGLATVYSIVRKHSGHIAVESEVGRGTTFRVWLPAASSAPAPAAAGKLELGKLSGRVLFMDDEEPIRAMTKALLERLGLEAAVAADGEEAIREYTVAHASGRPFDAVIMDLTVAGGMGGAEAMREILKIDPEARGIVSSGYSSDPVMANFRAHGFRGMVPKPYRVADFVRTLREVLNRDPAP